MKYFGYLFLLSMVIASCATPVSNTKELPTGRAADIAGSYQDTMPCSDCKGIFTELVLYPDSTYMLRERHLGSTDAAKNMFTTSGRYQPEKEWSMIRLMPKNQSANRWFALSEENALTMLDGQGAVLPNAGDLTLERQDKIVKRQGDFLVRYTFLPHETNNVRVFSHIGSKDLVIDKVYLDGAPESEKALVAYYALKFNAGCAGSSCALNEALGMDNQAMLKLIKKWMPKQVAPRAEMDSTKKDLTTLFFVKNDQIVTVNCTNAASGAATERLIETYAIAPDRLELVSSTIGAIQEKVIEENSKKPTEYPQGGKQILDPRKDGKKKEVEIKKR